jgi:pimeloyl-ACP methyl ester carboxylesterase
MQTFRSDDVEIAYRDIPAESADLGEPILLIHGFASSHRINWVDPRWAATLTKAGRRTIVFDNRGHGQSQKLYDPQDYATPRMAEDAAHLLAHLGIARADVMGYSMGARIGAFLALQRPDLVRSLILGGLGIHLVEGVGLPLGIADAMEAPSLESLSDPMQRLFRAFADQNRSDLRALAACIRGSRQTLAAEAVAAIACPTLVAVGTADPVAGDAHALAALFRHGAALDIPGRDHNRAVGDRVYKEGVLAFLAQRP